MPGSAGSAQHTEGSQIAYFWVPSVVCFGVEGAAYLLINTSRVLSSVGFINFCLDHSSLKEKEKPPRKHKDTVY